MPKVKATITRMKSEKKYYGGPCELSITDPSTFRQVIQYYYYLVHINPNADIVLVTQQISKNIKSIWATINPSLPLITDKSINRKVKDLLVLVKDINRKHGKASAKRNLDANLDKLFDISACSCSLDVFPCSDRKVSCNKENCIEEHIVCFCSQSNKVPLEDRAYLRDQRKKIGPKGAYQLSSVDRFSVKRIQRLDKERKKKSHKLVDEDESLIRHVNLIEETSDLTNTEVNIL